MKRSISFSVTAIAFVVGALLISGCVSTKPLTAEQKNYPVDKVDAHGIFLENCATCHGKDGRAKTLHGRLVHAQNLTNPTFQSQVSNDDIRNAILTGPKAMPAFDKKLSSSEIEAMVAYVRSLKAAE